MSEPAPRDAWHEELLATLRARAEKSRRQADSTPIAEVPVYNWPEVSSRLSRAAAVAVPDATILVGRHHSGLRRTLILGLRGAIASLLRFLTSRQSEYNLGVLHALRETGRAVRSLEQRLAASEKEIGHLRKRISHLEAHLPAEGTRKAS